ncbi:MAG: zinc ribbon domain-containing protein [Anaerolineaceae bacterium]|jgi:hypothetical protein|nr:zinc ribbon domain-containing protein [Anaerolineaceae bacterium]
MEQRLYHGNFTNNEIADALIAHFDHGSYRVQKVGAGKIMAVQIATSPYETSGGKTALSITLQNAEDGVLIQIGQQTWMGVAADLGVTTIAALRNPLSLLGRLDDIAQDIQNLQLTDEVWQTIDQTSRAIGSGFDLSARLKKYVCEYCNTPNEPGASSCIACGAPLGNIQPQTCPNCGYIISTNESVCPNCKKPIIR